MTAKLNRKTCCIFLSLIILIPNVAFGKDATLTNIIVTNTRDDLIVYMTVEGAFTEKMKTAILSGVPTSFSFFIILLEARNLWFDKKIADLKITNTIKYDNLKKEFIVKRSWVNEKPIVTRSLSEAQNLMADIDSIKVLPLDRLEKGRQYQIRAKAKLSKLTLPFYLHYVLFFVSLWDFETDWYTIDFIF
jgi:hypothetical protein